MLPTAARLVVSAFDLHLWPTPLMQSAAYSPALQFLATPDAYRTMRGQAGFQLSNGFRLFLVDADSADHHFWRRYAKAANIPPAPTPGAACEWLMPLRCRPISFEPAFQIDGVGPVRAHVTVWLWPFGWSSQVEFRLSGPLAFDTCQKVVAAISTSATKPFALNGQARSLPELFAQIGDRVCEDVAAPASNPLSVLQVSRRLVVGFVAEKGQEFRRFTQQAAPSDASPKRWSDSERAKIVSLLTGRDMPVQDVNKLDQPGTPYRHAQLGRGNYALTHPQSGALLMLRHHGEPGSPWRRTAQLCLIGNARASLISWAALGGLTGGSSTSPDHQSLITAGEHTARRLKSYYGNPVFQQATSKAA